MEFFSPGIGSFLSLPLVSTQVPAGFPSPASDYIEKMLDLNEHLISKPAATFLVRVSGDSMIDVGIFENDILIVDRSKTPLSGSIIVGVVNGEFTLKTFLKHQDKIILKPENKKYTPIEITQNMGFEVWGVVIHAIHSFKYQKK